MADAGTRTVVIKIGTSSLIREDVRKLNISCLAQICETVSRLRAAGYQVRLISQAGWNRCNSFIHSFIQVVLVSSGAVAAGGLSLGLAQRPAILAQKQALAATGQIYLMRYWQDFFEAIGLVRAQQGALAAQRHVPDQLCARMQKCAQVLLTLDNIAHRNQYLNARNTLTELMHYGVVPIINENDTVAVEELGIGDNDTLSAQVPAGLASELRPAAAAEQAAFAGGRAGECKPPIPADRRE